MKSATQITMPLGITTIIETEILKHATFIYIWHIYIHLPYIALSDHVPFGVRDPEKNTAQI